MVRYGGILSKSHGPKYACICRCGKRQLRFSRIETGRDRAGTRYDGLPELCFVLTIAFFGPRSLVLPGSVDHRHTAPVPGIDLLRRLCYPCCSRARDPKNISGTVKQQSVASILRFRADLGEIQVDAGTVNWTRPVEHCQLGSRRVQGSDDRINMPCAAHGR